MSSTIEVPDGCVAVIVTEQLRDTFADWTRVGPPPNDVGYSGVEVKVVPTDNPAIWDVQSRYV